jgi:hypothetical protein
MAEPIDPSRATTARPETSETAGFHHLESPKSQRFSVDQQTMNGNDTGVPVHHVLSARTATAPMGMGVQRQGEWDLDNYFVRIPGEQLFCNSVEVEC